MPGPAHEAPLSAEGRGRLLVSDAERDQVIDVLKAAFVAGRLARDEFGLRVGQVLVARTYADLEALVASVPERGPDRGPDRAVQPHGTSLVARKPPASACDPRPAPRSVRIARVIRSRQRLISLLLGMLLLVGGMGLASTFAFIAGVLLVGVSAPQALPFTPTSAMVRTWQWLYRQE